MYPSYRGIGLIPTPAHMIVQATPTLDVQAKIFFKRQFHLYPLFAQKWLRIWPASKYIEGQDRPSDNHIQWLGL